MKNNETTLKNHGNQPKTMKNHEATLKNHGNHPKTLKNHETTLKNYGNQPKTMKTMKLPWKTMETREGVGQGRNKQKRHLLTRGHNWPGEGGQGRNKQKRHLLTRGHNWPFRCLDFWNTVCIFNIFVVSLNSGFSFSSNVYITATRKWCPVLKAALGGDPEIASTVLVHQWRRICFPQRAILTEPLKLPQPFKVVLAIFLCLNNFAQSALVSHTIQQQQNVWVKYLMLVRKTQWATLV